MRPGRQQGFTLIEMVIALSIVGALLVIMFGGLRVGLGAWRRGEDRAEMLEHERNVEQFVNHAVTGSYLYQPGTIPGNQGGILFEGHPDRLAFVTVSPPVPPPVPIAFTVVTLSLEAGATPGLAVRQKAMPNTEPLEPVTPLFVDPAVTALGFRYLREAGGTWEERWDAAKEKALPLAVEVTLTTLMAGRRNEHPPLVIPIRNSPS